MISAAALELLYPAIAWRDPIKAPRTDGASGYACRVCIAQNGIAASEIPSLPWSPGQVLEHIAADHVWDLTESVVEHD